MNMLKKVIDKKIFKLKDKDIELAEKKASINHIVQMHFTPANVLQLLFISYFCQLLRKYKTTLYVQNTYLRRTPH